MGRPNICCGRCGCLECIRDLNVDNYEYAFIVNMPSYHPGYGPTYLNSHYLGDIVNDSSYVSYYSHWFITSETIKDELMNYIDDTNYRNEVKCSPKSVWQFDRNFPVNGTTNFLTYNYPPDGYWMVNPTYQKFTTVSKDAFKYARFMLKTGFYGMGYKPTVQIAMDEPELSSGHAYSAGLDIMNVGLVRMNKKTLEMCVIYDGSVIGLERGAYQGGELGACLGDVNTQVFGYSVRGYQPFCCNCNGTQYTRIAIEISGVEDIQYQVKYNPNDSDVYKPYIVSGDYISGCSDFNGTYIIDFNSFQGELHIPLSDDSCFGTLSPGFDVYNYTIKNGIISYDYIRGLHIGLPHVTTETYDMNTHNSANCIFSYYPEIFTMLCNSNPFECQLYNSGEPSVDTDRFHYFVPSVGMFGGSYVYENGYIAQSRPQATVRIYGIE